MHVALIVPLYPPTLGGAELQAQRLALEMVAQGAQVTVLTRPAARQSPLETVAGIRVVRGLAAVPLGPLWGVTYMLSTARWVRRLSTDWDVVHNQQVGLHSWPSMRIAHRLGKPCLLRFACSGPGGDLAILNGQRFGHRMLVALRDADRFVALSQGGAAELLAHKLPGERTRIIPNGVDAERFVMQPWLPVAARDPLRLLFVGRLDHQKGLDILLDALALTRDRTRFRLRIVGEGLQGNQLQQRVRDANLGGVVSFCGRQADVVPFYEWSEVVVLPSRFEGMPNVVLEAMACGRPVLATNVDGTRDLLQRGVGGWLTPSENPEALARRLEEIFTQRAGFAAIGLAGRGLVEQAYSVAGIAAMYLREYEALLSERIGVPGTGRGP